MGKTAGMSVSVIWRCSDGREQCFPCENVEERILRLFLESTCCSTVHRPSLPSFPSRNPQIWPVSPSMLPESSTTLSSLCVFVTHYPPIQPPRAVLGYADVNGHRSSRHGRWQRALHACREKEQVAEVTRSETARKGEESRALQQYKRGVDASRSQNEPYLSAS